MISAFEDIREQSHAFRQALLNSERKRVVAVIVFVSFFAILMLVRIFVLGSAMSRWGLLVLVVLIAFELGLLRAVAQAVQSDGHISTVVWYVSTIFEMLCPAVGVALLTSSRLMPGYQALATPWTLAFFPFILLSVLRLSPRLCWFAGAVSAVCFLGAAYISGWRFSPVANGFTVTQTAVLYYTLILLVTGALAGGVAAEIRTHVDAALREAETRHQLQQVEHELQIARSVQQSLLPKFRPQLSGFQVAGWNRPADDTGGDFYDWKRLPDGRLAVILADVTGHGIGPAILASVCRAYSRASFNDRDSLETTLRNINHSFAEDLTPESFATFVAAVCQDNSDQLEVLSAGHGPIFIFRAHSESFEYLDAQAVPLGILPEIERATSVKLEMKTGDMALLITDGFFEWENPREEQFGTNRLAEVVKAHRHEEPETIIAELYDAVLKFSEGTRQKDDLTAVLIKRTTMRPVVIAGDGIEKTA